MSLELADATTARRRVHALHALNVLDTPREQRYDRIVRLAQRVFDVPMVAVNLIDADRQWTKAEAGLDRLENTPPTTRCAATPWSDRAP